MEFLLGVISLFIVITLMITIWYLIRWIIGKADRKPIFRKRFFISIIVFLVANMGFGNLSSREDDKNSASLGFASTQDYRDAQKENITDPSKWAEIVSQRKAEEYQRIAEQRVETSRLKQEAEKKSKVEAEKKAKKEREKAEELVSVAKAKEVACRKDIKCWGEKANLVATYLCPNLVERFAKYDFEWTDGWTEPKFSHYRWHDIGAGTVTVIGDKIKMQNGFGAWTHMIYECDIDPLKEKVLDLRVVRGRI